jgi:hypothetical protein
LQFLFRVLETLVEAGSSREVIGYQALITPLKSALLACLTSQDCLRWTIAEIEELLNNLSIPCSKPTLLGALSELALDLSLCTWCPWNLVEHRSEWIFQPKTDVLALLSRVCRFAPSRGPASDRRAPGCGLGGDRGVAGGAAFHGRKSERF